MVSLVGNAQTVEIVARDRTSGSVVILSGEGSGIGPPSDLHGWFRVQPPPPGYGEPFDLLGVFSVEEPGDLPTVLYEGDRLLISGADGTPLDHEIRSYSSTRAINGKYEIHSGLLHERSGEADVFAITDPIEWVIGAIVGGACLAIYASQFWLLKQTIDGYRRQGLEPQWRIKSSVFKIITCNFDVVIQPVDPRTGEKGDSVTVHIGPEK